MKKFRIALALLLALVTVFGAYAQAKGQLTITVSEGPAQIILNGKLLGMANPTFKGTVNVGTYTLIVRKTGLPEVTQSITVTASGLTLNIPLGGTAVTPPPVVTPTPVNYTLSVNGNVAGADVYVNGIQAGKIPFAGQVPQGSYTVVVKAPGYKDFTQAVVVNGNVAVTANLVGNASLTVQANVAGADVYLNGAPAGKAPFTAQLAAGSYTVTVKAAGYNDFTQVVSVSGSSTVTATLTPVAVPLNLGNLFPGAEIFLNGVKIGVAGTGPFLTQVAPGTYTLTIRAGGFMDFTMQITVGTSGYSYTPVLQPQMATYTFQIPATLMNPEMRGNPWSQIRIFIDGVAQKDFKGQVQPGKRTIRMVTGAFQIEFIYEFAAGKTYVIEPFAGITVKE